MYELWINNSLIDDAKSFYMKQQCYITISLNKNTLIIIIATRSRHTNYIKMYVHTSPT